MGRPMPMTMMVLGIACLIAAAISYFRYEGKNFDQLVLIGVIFLSAAAPSFEVDSSIDELKSINQRLLDVQKAVEGLQKR
ncbi:MAG: hypothetical protein J0G37_14635 [Afipia sp.]|nr:hypothetical protein [Afipia sp.]